MKSLIAIKFFAVKTKFNKNKLNDVGKYTRHKQCIPMLYKQTFIFELFFITDIPKNPETRNSALPSSTSKSSVETSFSIKPQIEKKSSENMMKNFLSNSKATMENSVNSVLGKHKEGMDKNLLNTTIVTQDSTGQSNMSCSITTQNLAEDLNR